MLGRKEKRSQQEVEVMLSTIGEHPMSGELASMENVSSYGVRVRTERPWKPDTSVLFKSAQRDWTRARVIYCQFLNDKSFAVGLELPASGHVTDAGKDWDLTVRYRCPACAKGFAVVEWKKSPKCRQCGAELRIEDEPRKSPPQGS
jgi:DNA-directed RNA polymerase subunit RPC12/RpoP